MIRLIVSDLDGTLLHEHAHIREEDRAALQEAAGLGIQIAFASGRMHPEIVEIASRFGLSVHSVSQNGAFVRLADGTPLLSGSFDRRLLQRLAATAASTPLLGVFSGPDGYMVPEWSSGARRIRDRVFAPFHVVPDLFARLEAGLPCAKLSFFGDLAELTALGRRLKEAFGGAIDVYVSDADCMDVMPAGISKGIGLTALLEALKVRPEETLCVGDSFNDISMFGITPHSCSMAGSHPDVRARSSRTVRGVHEAVRLAVAERGLGT